MELSLLLENLKQRFDPKRFKPSNSSRRRHSGLRDAFFETTFQEMFVESSRSDRDDLLFYIKYDHNEDKDILEVLRRDSKTLQLPTSTDPFVLWDKTLYLNLILHEFEYHVTCSVITLKQGSDSISSAKKTVKLKVFPSPTERRMDKKGGGNDVIYPDIMFCVDNFEEIFNSVRLSVPGEKVAVQLMAVNKSCRVSRMVFLGAVDYQALKAECIKRDQNSLSRRLKRLSLTRHSSNGKKRDLSQTYSFVKMHGPKMKGFAEMAVAKASRELVPPIPAPKTIQQQPPVPIISPRLVIASTNGSQPSQKTVPQIIVPSEPQPGLTSLHIRAHSSPAPKPYHERSYSSPVTTNSPDEAYSTASPSHSSMLEAEDFRPQSRPTSGVLTRNSSRDSFLSDLELDMRHERSQSCSGILRDNDTVSVTSTVSATSTSSSKAHLKLGSSGRSRSKSGSDMSMPVSAYLTYITLPWHCIVDDILNSTRKRVL